MPFFYFGNRMKIFFVISSALFFLTACQQLLNGQQQPVKTRSNGDYFVGCGGAVETWGSCNNKAMNTCPKGYDVIAKDENSTGTVRELTFKCRK
jgi:hypothetical protein